MSERHMRFLPLTLVVMITYTTSFAQPPEKAEEEEQPGEDESTALAKKTQNPVSDLISLPFQMNFYSGGDLGDSTSIIVNIQPVLPVHVTDDYNAIIRPIVPVASVPESDGTNAGGLGDIVLELFASPAHPGHFTWGLGPIFSFPTATLGPLETGSWGLGPAAVGLYMGGPWVAGILVTQTWAIADYGDDPELNSFATQPFINFNFGKGWALSTSPVISANWNAPDNGWVVPLGAGMSYTTRIAGQALMLEAQYYRNVQSTPSSGDNQLRLEVSFLFPEKKKPAPAAHTAAR